MQFPWTNFLLALSSCYSSHAYPRRLSVPHVLDNRDAPQNKVVETKH